MVHGHFDFVIFFDLCTPQLHACLSDVHGAENMLICMFLKGPYFILHHIDHDSGGGDLHFYFTILTFFNPLGKREKDGFRP